MRRRLGPWCTERAVSLVCCSLVVYNASSTTGPTAELVEATPYCPLDSWAKLCLRCEEVRDPKLLTKANITLKNQPTKDTKQTSVPLGPLFTSFCALLVKVQQGEE